MSGPRVGPDTRDAASRHFHLRHRGGAVIAIHPRDAARDQLLRAKRAEGDKLVRIHVRRSRYHGRATARRVNSVDDIVTGDFKGSSPEGPW